MATGTHCVKLPDAQFYGEMRNVTALIVAVATLTACATQSEALRASDSSSSSPGAGAYYDIDPKGATLGDVKVWSNGAREENDLIVVEVSLRMRNNTNEPLVLDLSGCGLEILSTKEVQAVEEETSAGVLSVVPGALERITIKYTLPAKTDLDKVSGFDFYWRVMTPDGPYTHSTSFQRAVRDTGGYYYSPYYYGGYGGFGFGPTFGPSMYYGGRSYRTSPSMHAAPPRR
ncbi:MAG: hypothetical protein H7Z43_11495 [Clostridia bacterium]|nr:hypothetical protein [Deltaproteobacteria bacterium]